MLQSVRHGEAALAVAPAPDGDPDGRWRASLSLRLERRRGRTLAVDRRHEGPLSIQRTFHVADDPACHLYLLHPPAGIVGGDQLAVSMEVASGAHGLATTPGATRWYRSDGAVADLAQTFRLARGASFEWLPQESLFFDRARARQTTSFELEETARLIGWECSALGRPGAAAPFGSGSLDLRLELHRGGTPVVLERLRTRGAAPRGLGDHAAYATLLATPATADALASVREAIAPLQDVVAGATLLEDVLVVRGLAAHAEPLTRLRTAAWSAVRPHTMGVAACAPRIWST